MEVILGKMLDVGDPMILKARLRFSIIELYLPTEVVITEPQVVAPHVARVQRTAYYDYNGRIVNYETLQASEGKNFKGTSHFPEVYLWEVWEDYGADGHVDFELQGYVFLSSTTHPIPENRCYPRHGLNLDYLNID